jgi:hypothetical protein
VCAGRQHAGREQQGATFEETPSEEKEHAQDLLKMEFPTLWERSNHEQGNARGEGKGSG